VNELYRRLATSAGVTRPARHGPAKPGEQRRSALDAARAKRLLGWAPGISLGTGLARTLAYVQAAHR
jgi:UDP-glucose 4-epimerase